MGFRLQRKLLTLHELERQVTAVTALSSVLWVYWLESRGFCYKVALYFRYLHITFDDEIGSESLRVSNFFYDYPASKVKLASLLGCIYSQSLLLNTSVTCLRRPLHTDSEGANNIA